MTKRERMILIAAMSVAGLWLFDSLFLGPWLDRWDELDKQIYAKRQELNEAEVLLEREREVRREWRIIENQLTDPGRAATEEALVIHLGDLTKRAKVNMNLKAGRVSDRGDFTEIGMELQIKTKIDGLRDLLVELYNSEEFLKVGRLSISSRPFEKTRKDELDVNVSVSTIEYTPKRNGKNGRKRG